MATYYRYFRAGGGYLLLMFMLVLFVIAEVKQVFQTHTLYAVYACMYRYVCVLYMR